jgi:hypothetical protein
VQAAAEAPVRSARRPLATRLNSATSSLHKANQRLADKLYYRAFACAGPLGNMKDGLKLWDFEFKPFEAACEKASANFRQALLDLQLFDASHGVEADYPSMPELDRDATVAQAKADFDAAMARAREWTHAAQQQIRQRREAGLERQRSDDNNSWTPE